MKIAERYAVARNTNSMKVISNTTFAASDVIGAVGMTRQNDNLAIMLLQSHAGGVDLDALADALERRLAGQMAKKRWKGHGQQIVADVLLRHLDGVCKPCDGRGYHVIEGAPMLSDVPCAHCQGNGRIRLQDTDAHRWLADLVDKLVAQAAGHIKKKLAIDSCN